MVNAGTRPAPHASRAPGPATLGLFEKRIEGDDCLLELAQRRFQQAGMGVEVHAGSVPQFEEAIRYCPSESAAVVIHLPRHCHLLDQQTHELIETLAVRTAGRVIGLVMHDHVDLRERTSECVRAAEQLNARLRHVDRCPMVFIEYAVGLEQDCFAGFFELESVRALDRIGTCIDIGHVGIREARSAYERIHPGEDVCALKGQPPELPERMADVEAAVQAAPARVHELIRRIGGLGKPVHFHLHDGHPLSTFSPFGVSDHLSFLASIPLHFEHRGRRCAPLMFGPDGLARVVATALESVACEQLSFTLEIHPIGERLDLGEAAGLFAHWRDKNHAQQMNHWLQVLADNHDLLREAIQKAKR